MKILVNEKISQHKYKTPEGYLICVDSVLARTGPQTYRKNELFVDAEDDSEIEVGRSPDEVFAPETLASFENKPITVEHPHEDVNIENYKDYAVGFVRDVKQGKFDGQDVILGTLVITDKDAIEGIENGEHVELSCGYDCDIEDGDDGYQQKHIRGNHVALCEAGRAGIAKIIDSVEDANYILSYNDKEYIMQDMTEAKRQGIKARKEKTADGLQVVFSGNASKLKDFVENYLGLDSTYISDSINDEIEMSKEEAIKEIEKILKDKRYVREDRYEGVEYFTREGMDKVNEIVDKSGLKRKDLEKISYLFGKGAYGPYFDSMKDAGEPRLDRAQRRMLQNYLSMISTFTTRDTDIKDVLRPLSGKGFKYTIDKIEGWIWKKGEMAYKNYYISLDGYKDKFMVTLYADPNKDWKVNEVNAYFTDSVKDETLYTVGYTGSIYTRDLKTKEFNDYNSALSFAKKMYRNPRNHTVKIYEGNIDGKVIWIQSKLGAGDSEVRDEDDKEKNFEIEYLDNNDAKCTQTVPAKTAKEAERKLKEVLPVYRILSVKQTKDSTPDEEQTEKLEEDLEHFKDAKDSWAKEVVKRLPKNANLDQIGKVVKEYLNELNKKYPGAKSSNQQKEYNDLYDEVLTLLHKTEDSISDSKVNDLNLNGKVSTSDLQNFVNKLTKKYLKEPYNANEWGTIDMKTGDPVLLKVQIILWMDVDKNWKPAMGKDLSELNNIRWEVGIYQKGASSRPGGDRREKEWSANSVKEAISQIPQVAKYANELYDDIVKGMKDSMEDAKELSATSVDYLDEMIERYRRKHPQAEFGEIEKRKDYYVVKILKDSMQEVPDSKLNDDKASNFKRDVVNWWKEVERWNNEAQMFKIENDYRDIEGLFIAIPDLIWDRRFEKAQPALAKVGERLYKRWKYDYHLLVDSINDAKEVRYQGYIIQEYHPLHDDPEGDGYIISKNGIIVGGADSIDEAIKKINRKELKKDSVEDRKNNVDKTKESTAIRQLIDILENGLAKKYGYKLYPDKIDIIGGGQFKITTQQYNRLKELGYSGIEDSINDVDPRSGESKEDFIARFMKETKNEYPDEKQRLAVAYSYWKNKGRDSMVKDAKWKITYPKDKPGKKEEVIEANNYREAKEYAAKQAHGWGFEIKRIEDSQPKDSIYTITIQGQKSKKLVRAKDAREAIDKYNKMFPKDKIKSVKKTDKFNNLIDIVGR